MIVKRAQLKNFRNLENVDVELTDGVNILWGKNAQGKTNFLESICFCATGRSIRGGTEKEMVKFDEKEGFVKTEVFNGEYSEAIEAQIRRSGTKDIALNGVPVKRLRELFDVLLTVVFSPQDLMLVKAGPAERRRFLDMEICRLSPVYYYDIQQYYRVLKQRNAYLKTLKKENAAKNILEVWDEQLIKSGVSIIAARDEFVQKIGKIAANIHGDIADGEKLDVLYKPNVLIDNFAHALVKNVERDIFMGTTTAGIHKDEIIFLINNFDARFFGSQGQQKTASLSLKLAEIQLIQEEKNQNPVLLLDDVFSELDEFRQKKLVTSVQNLQAIITSTGNITQNFNSSVKIFTVSNGCIA